MIIYAAIGRLADAAMLVDCCDPLLKGNAGVVMTTFFCHLKDHPEFLVEGEFQTFTQRNAEENTDFFSHFIEACSTAMGDDIVEQHYFHLYYMDGLIYSCIGDDQELRDQKVNFAFLSLMCKEFTRLHNARRIRAANAYAMENTFQPNLRSSMHHYNVNHDQISKEAKVKKLESQLQDFKKVMGVNINLLMERGESLDSMVHRSEELEVEAQVFRKRSAIILRRTKKKYYKTVLIYVGLAALVIGVVALLAMFRVCGIDLSYCRGESDGDN
eukprot:CAMPEP_0198144094 /NCGR_PEP_ID=MMETSP1443-20131203/12969_1 /TAXON_ID=186043 /ORGANISM="Entomoneis sp., Strain CCMP2396" /LENGTH=270 /DNA_ID=CAMNT_0043807437 /DNA_START=85 /DNA_END=897 /DNA_ORIENTATION=-